jgi:FkbM family methyltransferase
MKRFLFFVNAYRGIRKFQLLILLLCEQLLIIHYTRKWFRTDLIESRSLLGYIFDNGGNSRSSQDGMLIDLFCNTKFIQIYLRWGSSDFLAFNQVFIKEEYKKLTRLKNADPIIVDAGANIGCTTLYFYSFYPDAYIIAIEPDKENFNALTRNVRLNNLKNIYLTRAALWYKKDTVTLTNNYRDQRQWSIQVSDHGDQVVESKTLHDIVGDAGKNKIDVLKMDIEGAEKSVFKLDINLESVLYEVQLVGVEVHDQDGAIENKLKLMGFNCSTVGETLFAEKLI